LYLCFQRKFSIVPIFSIKTVRLFILWIWSDCLEKYETVFGQKFKVKNKKLEQAAEPQAKQKWFWL